jgi:hypothetical protein
MASVGGMLLTCASGDDQSQNGSAQMVDAFSFANPSMVFSPPAPAPGPAAARAHGAPTHAHGSAPPATPQTPAPPDMIVTTPGLHVAASFAGGKRAGTGAAAAVVTDNLQTCAGDSAGRPPTPQQQQPPHSESEVVEDDLPSSECDVPVPLRPDRIIERTTPSAAPPAAATTTTATTAATATATAANKNGAPATKPRTLAPLALDGVLDDPKSTSSQQQGQAATATAAAAATRGSATTAAATSTTAANGPSHVRLTARIDLECLLFAVGTMNVQLRLRAGRDEKTFLLPVLVQASHY